jgi:cbb3-type cytochrome oxidase subunit 3
MIREVLANFPYIWIPVLAFTIFFAIFIGVLIITLNKGNKNLYSYLANAPLDKGNQND